MVSYLRCRCRKKKYGLPRVNDDKMSKWSETLIQSGRSLFLSKIKKNTSLKLPVGVSSLQRVNLQRNRRYFVIKLHTWFCLSYFLKTNIKLYCIYQYFMSINSFFNTVSVSRYSRNFNS